MILGPLPLTLTPDHDIPAPVLTELTALYASNRAFHALSGDFPDPDDVRPEQVATAPADELVVRGRRRCWPAARAAWSASPSPWPSTRTRSTRTRGSGC